MAGVRAFELRLSGKQQLFSLLYLAGKVKAATLLARLDGAQEMSLLRLTEGETAHAQMGFCSGSNEHEPRL